MNVHNARNQRGFTLTEALVSFAITASGLLVIASFQAGLFSGSAYNKARTEALSLAQQKIEQFRHYTHASDDNFIDDDGDGVMDADGNYEDAPIDGQNARFTRSWALSTSGKTKKIDVTVSWQDRADEAQSVMLATELAWVSPRAGADQLAELSAPLVPSPTGRAKIGDGNLADYPAEDISPVEGAGPDGLSLYQHKENLLLVDGDNKILLTLLDACLTADGTCKDFVRISGTVYVDKENTSQELADIHVIAADAAHCERWVPAGTLTSPPTTDGDDYAYYNYTCYLGGGWHGNIGFVTGDGLKQRDKICQGDPTAVDTWAQPVIALRRAYRGMVSRQQGDVTVYSSQGIRDAVILEGQDFVFTELSPGQTEGIHCVGSDAPMTRDDSSGGLLFKDVPTDFVCLNHDADGDSIPDFLDSYDTDIYAADVTCPFDPTDPPVQSHLVSGSVFIESAGELDLTRFNVVTSDGPGNCEISSFTSTIGGYEATYSCNIYDWGSGWNGSVQLRPNATDIYCPVKSAAFTAVTADLSRNFECEAVPTVTIEGSIMASGNAVSAISIIDSDTLVSGSCEIMNGTSYSCQAPYVDSEWNGKITVISSGYVCGATAGVFTFVDYTADGSPYTNNIVVAKNSSSCPSQ